MQPKFNMNIWIELESEYRKFFIPIGTSHNKNV